MVALTLVIASLLVSTLLYRWFRRPSVKYVKGPPSASFWLGHERVLRNQDNAGDLETNWRREYGTLSCWGLLWARRPGSVRPQGFRTYFPQVTTLSKIEGYHLHPESLHWPGACHYRYDEPQTARITGENEQGYAKRKTPSPAEGEIWAEEFPSPLQRRNHHRRNRFPATSQGRPKRQLRNCGRRRQADRLNDYKVSSERELEALRSNLKAEHQKYKQVNENNNAITAILEKWFIYA